MSTHVPGFQSCFMILHHLVLAKLATSSIRVNRFKPERMDMFLALLPRLDSLGRASDGAKKKILFVSCNGLRNNRVGNPTLTSFYSKQSLP